MMMQRFSTLWFFASLVLLSACRQVASPTPIVTTLGSPTSVPSATAAATDWKTYTNRAFGYSLKYPVNWEVSQETSHSTLFDLIRTTPTGPTLPAFYVSVIPAGFANADASSYNFIPDDSLNGLLTAKVGEQKQTNTTYAEYFTFARLPDMTIGGQTAAVIENDKVWEADKEVKDRRVLIHAGSEVVMLGTYYRTPAELEQFQQVVLTFYWSPLSAATPTAPSITPQLNLGGTPGPTINPFLQKNALGGFPFPAGTTWVYSRVQYQQVVGDPTRLITATNLITTTVIRTEVITPSVALQFKQTASLLSAAPGWEDDSSNFNSEFWYLLVGNQVFLSYQEPQSAQPPKLKDKGGEQAPQLVYDFPLAEGKSWCPSDPPPSYNPQCSAMGKRTVDMETSQTTPLGIFAKCYEITEDYNSGGVTEWFCNGIGVVARKFDHSGSRFGFQDTLIRFSTAPIP